MLQRGEAIAGLHRRGYAGRWFMPDFAAIRSSMMDGAVGVDRDGDVPSVDKRVVIVTFGHEVLDVVVPAECAVVAMVYLHEGGGAARPRAGAESGMHRPTLLWGDGCGPAAEVERIACVGVEDGEQVGIAGQPACGSAQDVRA